MKLNLQTLQHNLSKLSFNRAGLLIFFLLFFSIKNLSAQVSQDSSTVSDTVSPKSASKSPDTTVNRVPVPKRVVRVKKDTTNSLVIDSSDTPKKLENYSSSDTLANYPVDSIPYRYKSLYEGYTENLFNDIISFNTYFNFLGEPAKAYEQIRKVYSYDGLFYLVVGILFYFALVKVLFGKYLANLFTLFFRVSMRQQQIREQVLQSPLPSLSLNVLFVIVGGLYIAFIVKHYQPGLKVDFWLMFLNFSAILCLIYLGKFLLLKCAGWVFNIQRATDTYIFIVFLTNKMLSIFLLPFLIMLSFSGTLLNEIAITISLIMIFAFFSYRCIASYGPLRKEIKMNGFHFFLYLCAFEIAPLLLIYRVLLSYLGNAWY